MTGHQQVQEVCSVHEFDEWTEQCQVCGVVLCDRCGERVGDTFAPDYGANFCGPCLADLKAEEA